MRKVLIPLAMLIALAAAGTAYALNIYTVEGSVSPNREGSPRNPVPVGIDFGYTIDTDNGQRPTPIEKYSIRFAGGRVNTQPFPKCSFREINNNGDAGCPRGSVVGNGFITNATGPSNDPASRAISCNAALTVYNAGNNKAVIFVEGNPNSPDERTRCEVELRAPISAGFVKRGQFLALEFRVPESLLHPLPGLDNAVTSVESSIKRLTRRVRGRTVGFFENVGGCGTNRRLRIQVVFDPEEGESTTRETTSRCRPR